MYTPWKELESWKNGNGIEGEWPTIPEMFDITVSRYPDSRAFTSFTPDELVITYREAKEYIKNISSYLISMGIMKGDRVAVYGKNSPEWAIAYLSIIYMGGVVVPVDYGLSADEVVELIKLSGSKGIFSEKDRIEKIKEGSDNLRVCLSLNPGVENYTLGVSGNGDEIYENPWRMILLRSFILPDNWSSKGVMLSHRNFTSDAFLAQGNLVILHSDVFYALLPIHHSYTMTSVFLETNICRG